MTAGPSNVIRPGNEGGLKGVSVIIRNLNEGSDLAKVLNALSVQRNVEPEIIVVDNESTDDSVRIAEAHGAKILVLPRQRFTYGRALNLGLGVATHEICVILSAHSMPLGVDFLAACCEPFDSPDIAAARCVYAGKSADLVRWVTPEILRADASLDAVLSKGPLASGCAIRRSVWQKIPFDEELSSAEDKKWALEALREGFGIYSPCAAMYSYIKTIPPVRDVQNHIRDIEAVYGFSSQAVGFVKLSAVSTVLNLVRSLLITAPLAAVNVAHVAILTCFYILRFKARARFGRKP